MQKAYWILAIITMSILLIINVLMLIERIKLNKKQKKVEDTIVISLELDTTELEKELKKVSKKTKEATKKPRAKKTNLQDKK